MRHSYKSIIVHGGQAHADDCLSLMVLLAVIGIVPVYRRDPTAEEIEDPAVLCVDVGGVHDPARSCYDHHQMERTNERCALSLIIEDAANFPELACLALAEWVGRVAVLDTQGPFAFSKRIGISPDAFFKCSTRIQGVLLSLVEKNKGEDPMALSTAFCLQEMGFILMDEAKAFQASYDRLLSAPRVEVGGLHVLVNESEDTMASNKVREDLLKEGVEVAASVSWDDRGPGWALYRFADHPAIDLSRLEGREEIEFAHKGGFIAKTKERCSLEDALNLVRAAIVQ